MFELPVAAAGDHQHPARQLQLLDDLADLHSTSFACSKIQCLLMGVRVASVRPRNSEKEASR